MLKELDDKTESLRISAAEIIDLRRQIKLLQSENAILRKRLQADDLLQIETIVTREMMSMNPEQLRSKVVKLA